MQQSVVHPSSPLRKADILSAPPLAPGVGGRGAPPRIGAAAVNAVGAKQPLGDEEKDKTSGGLRFPAIEKTKTHPPPLVELCLRKIANNFLLLNQGRVRSRK
jgi:hypothetical protein